MEKDTSKKCTACGGATVSIGQIPFRTHGSTGMGKLFLGDWAELNEEKVPIDIFRCETCGHLEMYDLDKSLPHA
jgi:hypothetical protein